MKTLIPLLLSALLLASCASMEQAQHYRSIAKEQPLDYFFPKAASEHSFDTLDEAFDFVNEAQMKLEMVGGKRSVQGLAAKLKGPAPAGDKPVTVGHFMIITDRMSVVTVEDWSKLAEKLDSAISIQSIFLVFFEDRAVSISDFYLASAYHYSNNNQYRRFNFKGNNYDTEYPVGWATEKAFQYLRKDRD